MIAVALPEARLVAIEEVDAVHARKALEIIRHSYYEDETAKVCDLYIPETHYLESWGDARTADGTYVPVQPLIAPLYGGLSEIELLAHFATAQIRTGHDIARDTFRVLTGTAAENDWKQFLHDGFWKNTAAQPANVGIDQAMVGQASQTAAAPTAQNLELVLFRDNRLDDGRYANNGWLQEMPDPVTKITWENVILVSRQTALDLGFSENDFRFGAHELRQKDHPRGVPTGRLTVGGKEIVAPVWLQLVHLLLADLLWISLVILAASALQVRPDAAARVLPVEAGTAGG